MNNWQPIETAPRDGTWVLVCGGATDDEEQPRSHAVAQWAVAQWTDYLNGGKTRWHWQFAWYDGGYYGVYKDPTHWMPLPEQPDQLPDGL